MRSNRRPGRDRSAVHCARSALEIVGDGLVGGEEAGLGAGLDSHVRHRQPLVDRQRLGAFADELERHVRAAGDADVGDHRQDQVLAGDVAPLAARELDPDRARHGLPERARRETGGDVGRAEPGAEGAERPVGARVRVAAGDHRSGDDPALFDEDGVLDAAAPLLVVGDALRIDQSRSSFCSSAERVSLAGTKWSGTTTTLAGSNTRVGAHLLHRPERHRSGDVVRHHDVTADHDDVPGGDLVHVRVCEQDLLGERVRHGRPLEATTEVVLESTPPCPSRPPPRTSPTPRARRSRWITGSDRSGAAPGSQGLPSPFGRRPASTGLSARRPSRRRPEP